MSGGEAAKRLLARALRELRGDTPKSVPAGVLGCSVDKIDTIERALVGVDATDLEALLNLYDVPPGAEREGLVQLGRESQARSRRTPWGPLVPSHTKRFFRLEGAADSVWSFDEAVVPGLLQTREYAREVLRTNPDVAPNELELLVDARCARQSRLTDGVPLQVCAVVGEAALRSQVGGPDMLRRQLAHLRAMANLPTVTIQVVPFTAGAHAASGYPFMLLWMPGDNPDLPYVYQEKATTAQYIDNNPDEQRRYQRISEHVTDAALAPDASLAILDKLVGHVNDEEAP